MGLGFSESINENAIYSSSMKELGQVFWPGGPWYTPRGWTLPTSAKPLRIGVPVGSIFKQYVKVEYDQSENKTSYTGFAINVFKATVERLPFHLPYNFFPFNGTYNALVEQIHLKNFDAVIGDIAVMAKQHQHAEFTHPYTESGLRQYMSTMVLLYGIERNNNPELKGSVLNQLGTLMWLAYGTLFSIHGERIHSNLSRMTIVVWVFVALVIMQTYTAILTSMLTFQQLEPTIADVEALQNSNAMVGHRNGSFVSEYLADVLHFKPDNIKAFTSLEAYAQALRSKEIAAASLEYPLAKLFLAKYCKGFTISGPTYKFGGFGFVILLLLSFAFLFIKTYKIKTVIKEVI
ncbi:hypothetical protein CMV_029734 [Castanea mollissima]|uniref:Ionotropic glutamate receptor C-terminal domain-containing protein n=1 Tax=Castanea mollissima TaxID=60419 RepID=A0A8J4QDS2_9ROSI|nr:hypothetical protein CMV_029734 [Castanea mollissima]